MKLLFIMGSPRTNGNTARILQRIRASVPEAWEVETVLLPSYHINGCTGCCRCQQDTEHFTCVQQDDGNLLLEKVIQADAVLYGTPLYGHNYSGQLKLFLDRHVPLFKFVSGSDKSVDQMEILSIIEQKPVGLIVSCQGPEANNTELIQLLFDKFCESSLARCMGKYVFPFCGSDAGQSFYNEATLQQILEDLRRVEETLRGPRE